MRTMIAAAAFVAAIVAALGCNIPAAYAFGDAPWCAVKNFGSDVVWDCEYRTVEECVPHVIAGDRSFCNLNPWPGPATPAPRADRRKRQADR
jgi:hypothetical protein